MNSMRASTLDKLHYLLEANRVIRREKEMKMVRHDDKFVKKISVSIAIVEESVDKDFSVFRNLEDGAALPTLGSDEVRAP